MEKLNLPFPFLFFLLTAEAIGKYLLIPAKHTIRTPVLGSLASFFVIT